MQTSTPMGSMGMQNQNLQQQQSDKYEIFSNGPGNMAEKAEDSLYNIDMDNIPQPQMQARGSLEMH